MVLSLGSAFDPFRLQKVWEETLKREAACQKISEEFRINKLLKESADDKANKAEPEYEQPIHSQDPNDDLGDGQGA